MAVLLKNLLARRPKAEDLEAIKELVTECDIAEHALVGSTMEDLIVNWQRFDFNLATDAWIIVTNKGLVVGFACVWHRDYEQVSTFVWLHTEYRGSGIGKRLFEREGYIPIRQFWRIAVKLDESVDRPSRHADLKIDLDVVSQRLVGAAQLYDRDALYTIREHHIYEKELRAGEQLCVSTDDERKAVMVAG